MQLPEKVFIGFCILVVGYLLLSLAPAEAKEYAVSCGESTKREDGSTLKPKDIKEYRILNQDTRKVLKTITDPNDFPVPLDIDGTINVMCESEDQFTNISGDSATVALSDSPPVPCEITVTVKVN